MIKEKDIIKDGHPTLRLKAEPLEYPIKKDIIKKGIQMLEYLKMSQDDELSKKYNMRAGVGLAAPQINISKRFFALYFSFSNIDYKMVIFNPEIIAESVEMIYLGGGEGCLSVPEKSGHVLRHKKIKVKATIYDALTKKIEDKTITLSGYPAIVFQHEYDHLNGILFTDKLTDNVLEYEAI